MPIKVMISVKIIIFSGFCLKIITDRIVTTKGYIYKMKELIDAPMYLTDKKKKVACKPYNKNPVRKHLNKPCGFILSKFLFLMKMNVKKIRVANKNL